MLKSKGMAVAIASLGLAATAAFADDAPAPPASPHTVTGNVSFLSDYVVRGLTQTNNKPAIQGTIEYGHASGFYAGAFALDEVKLPGEEGTTVQLLSAPLYAAGQLDRLLKEVFGTSAPAGKPQFEAPHEHSARNQSRD